MNLIVFDIEIDRSPFLESEQKFRIFGITAIKIDSVYGRLVKTDSFHRDIFAPNIKTPKIESQISWLISNMQDFTEWIGEGEYYLFSWGEDVLGYLFLNRTYGIYPMDWIKNYTSIQESLSQYFPNKENTIGLKSFLLQNKKPANYKNIVLKTRMVAEIVVENLDTFQFKKNTLEELMSQFSSPTHRACKICRLTKWCGEYEIKLGKLLYVCKECLNLKSTRTSE